MTRRDGQSHSVDSNEIAFRTAAKMAVLESMMKANPLLLGTALVVVFDCRAADVGGDRHSAGVPGRDYRGHQSS